WPIGYDDLAPHYGAVERFMRAHGHPDGLGQLPDGELLPAFPLTPAEARLRAEVEAAWPERRVIAARGVPVPDRFDEWPRFTAQAMLAEATRTGLLELRTGCAAHEILVDPREGLARGVRYLHLGKGEEREAPAGLVLVCASTVGTLRLLLSSGGAFAPAGLGNENGLLGRGLMDHVSFAMLGEVPDPPAAPPPPFGGPHGVLLPRFRNLAGRRPDYVGGFGYWGGAGRAFGGSRFLFVGYGEVLPRPDNAVTLDASRRDAAGRPLAHVAMSWGDNERAMMRDARDCLREMLERAGMRITHESDALQVPGRFVHETGGAPMGETPRASVLDPENRLWSVPNVLVVDGACFPRCGYQNPTLTMLALCDRACDRLVARLARGERRARPGGPG
ncbi:MAG TPA: GMC family oxidoreductase, partial [Polyangiaceae bacterium]|nr:GMC family oxidoreductase [Polyangiaceae bacterium]